MYTATITGRGMLHLPAELRRRTRLKPGDKVDLRLSKDAIVMSRIPTLAEGFGLYSGLGRQMARELLEEKRAEMERELKEVRPKRRGRGDDPKVHL